jgi:hypothetical protein
MKFLVRLGLIRIVGSKIRWPLHMGPWHLWKMLLFHGPRIGVFRNRPGVIRDIPGRLLPRRWGFFILGFEFGDRG